MQADMENFEVIVTAEVGDDPVDDGVRVTIDAGAYVATLVLTRGEARDLAHRLIEVTADVEVVAEDPVITG
jgi:hypothetical protein